MSKSTEKTEEESKPEVTMKQISLDEVNGIVVYKTNAEDGTGFTLQIEKEKVKADAKDGQVWFYADASIAPDSLIRVV